MSPALLIVGGAVALIIKLGSRGPIFYRQERVGYRGSRFTIFKFRTMQVNAETDSHRRHTQHLIASQKPMTKLDAQNDPRLVPLGSVMRACGLDELPQLINVVRGEMSLVGPRPCIPYEFELHQPWQRRRYNATPGLTGLWQVNGKNRTTFEEMVWFDLEYAEKKSLTLDLKILFRTLPAIWQQYNDLKATRRKEAEASETELGKSIQSYRL
jgi:lipopolysaccharide/colanic/teichoic acid biosynthesis glycosyltransferase